MIGKLGEETTKRADCDQKCQEMQTTELLTRQSTVAIMDGLTEKLKIHATPAATTERMKLAFSKLVTKTMPKSAKPTHRIKSAVKKGSSIPLPATKQIVTEAAVSLMPVLDKGA